MELRQAAVVFYQMIRVFTEKCFVQLRLHALSRLLFGDPVAFEDPFEAALFGRCHADGTVAQHVHVALKELRRVEEHQALLRFQQPQGLRDDKGMDDLAEQRGIFRRGKGAFRQQRTIEAAVLFENITAKTGCDRLQTDGAFVVDVRDHFVGVAVKDFKNIKAEWTGENNSVLSKTFSADLGLFTSPDELLDKHTQSLNPFKAVAYGFIARRFMNRSIKNIRNSAEKE